MSLPKVQPAGGTPTTKDFILLQSQWAIQLESVIAKVNQLRDFVGDTVNAPGKNGLVPAPAAGDSAANKFLNADGSWIETPTSLEIAVFNDTKSIGTAGGTFTAGAWRTRDLNTVQAAQGWSSLAINQITILSGTYFVIASAPAFDVDRHQIQFYNITDSTIGIVGQSSFASAASSVSNFSYLSGVITLSGSKVFELQHRGASSQASNGFGVESSFGSEVYSIVMITKLKVI